MTARPPADPPAFNTWDDAFERVLGIRAPVPMVISPIHDMAQDMLSAVLGGGFPLAIPRMRSRLPWPKRKRRNSKRAKQKAQRMARRITRAHAK